MGYCYSTTLYKFQNFISVRNSPPQPKPRQNISKFQFQIHPFSTSYIRQKIDNNFNPDLDGEQSFLVSEVAKIKVFEKDGQLITKTDNISDCLSNALIAKICGQSVFKQRNCVIFVEPQCKYEHKNIIFTTIISTLISIDLTCFNVGRSEFGVYFDWPQFTKDQRNKSLLGLIQQIHKRNRLMDSTIKSQ